jgi:hypothetical protein
MHTCFAQLSEYKVTAFLNYINKLLFIVNMQHVSCEVETEFLNVVYMKFVL